ncbi:DUF3592 domain-containing protein [Nonomuraea purpurea]
MTVEDYWGLRRIQQHGLGAEATVVDVHRPRKRPEEVRVRFVTRDGATIEAWVGVHRWAGLEEVGARREILYDPADPEGGVLDKGETWLHETHLYSAVAVLVLLVTAFVLWRPKLVWAVWDRVTIRR